MSKRSENQHFSKVSVMQFRGSFSICYLPSYADTKGLLDFYSLLLPFVLVIDFSGFEFRKCLCSWPLPSLRSTDPQALQRGRDFVRLSPSPLAWPPPPETGLRLGHSPSQKSSMTSRYLFFFFPQYSQILVCFSRLTSLAPLTSATSSSLYLQYPR